VFNLDLKPICDLWWEQIAKSDKHKKEHFGNVAEQCWGYYDLTKAARSESADLALGLGASIDDPATPYVVRIGKFAELVDLFGPMVWHKNPSRVVRSKRIELPQEAFSIMGQAMMAQMGGGMGGMMPPIDPMTGMPIDPAMILQQQYQMQGLTDPVFQALAEGYLNYTPTEFGLKHESRLGCIEGLIKGRGVNWHEMHMRPGSQYAYPVTLFDSVDNLGIDADASSLRTALFTYRWCCEPYYLVEREYGWPPGSLKEYARAGESYAQQAQVESSAAGEYRRKQGDTGDMLRYVKIYSKCGIANHKAAPSLSGVDSDAQARRMALDSFGDNVFLVLAPGIPQPLNMPPYLMDLDISQPAVMEYFKDHFRWPLPYYMDSCDHFGGWPFSTLDFHPKDIWPRAHMSSALAEMQFINQCFSFLMGRMEWSCRTIIAYAESLDGEIKEQLRTGKQHVLINIKRSLYKKISDAVEFLQHPPLNPEFWQILSSVMDLFDKRTGLIEYLYGQSSSESRSATESAQKQQALQIRPDDMAEMVEDWESRKAKKELQAARWKVNGAAAGQILRDQTMIPQLWDQIVAVPLNYDDPASLERVVSDYECTVEAGSVRKPNKEREQNNMQQALGTMGPMLQTAYQTTGDPTQINALFTDWAKSLDLDVTPYLLPDLRMQMMMAQQQAAAQGAEGEGGGEGGGGEQQPPAQAA
jgi:hypothetical protein